MENIIQINDLSRSKHAFNSSGKRYTAVGHDGKTIPETTDAQVWAQEFVTISDRLIQFDSQKPEDMLKDEGWMIGWFANAIEAGRAAGRNQGE
jgi:photosystem II stability/assembly factor-like uncharacterized protein